MSASEVPQRVERQATETRSLKIKIKRLLQTGFDCLTVPRLINYWIGCRILGPRMMTVSSESIAKISGLRGVYSRQSFYRQVLQHCDRDVYIGWSTVFSMSEAVVGERAYIGRFCSIGYAHIGAEVMLADGVQILSGGREHNQSDSQDSMHEQGQTYTQVRIGDGAWIGAGAIVMCDVGEHAIVGAGAVVSKPIPAGAVAVGVPAKVVKWRNGWSEQGRVS